jgi:hypothetical protein
MINDLGCTCRIAKSSFSQWKTLRHRTIAAFRIMATVDPSMKSRGDMQLSPFLHHSHARIERAAFGPLSSMAKSRSYDPASQQARSLSP